MKLYLLTYIVIIVIIIMFIINTLQTNGRLLYLKTPSVPRSKHFSSRL